MKVELERAVAIQGMQENWILAIMPKYGNSAPGAQKINFFRKFLILMERSLNFTSNEPSTTPDIKFESSYTRKHDYAQIWKFSPRLPKKEFFKKNHFFKKVSRFCFQRALNHPQTLSLTQVMQENVILAYYAQIWKFGPGSQKWNFSKNFYFSEKVFKFHF